VLLDTPEAAVDVDTVADWTLVRSVIGESNEEPT
jgi:hypothetical protein